MKLLCVLFCFALFCDGYIKNKLLFRVLVAYTVSSLTFKNTFFIFSIINSFFLYYFVAKEKLQTWIQNNMCVYLCYYKVLCKVCVHYFINQVSTVISKDLWALGIHKFEHYSNIKSYKINIHNSIKTAHSSRQANQYIWCNGWESTNIHTEFRDSHYIKEIMIDWRAIFINLL